MDHTTRDGRPRLLERCSYPLTAAGVVNRIFTNLCVIDVIDGGFVVREMIPGLSLEALQERTGAPLKLDPQWCELRAEAGAHAAA
jgi:3-oxoadipate CoA-transferase beta subunit